MGKRYREIESLRANGQNPENREFSGVPEGFVRAGQRACYALSVRDFPDLRHEGSCRGPEALQRDYPLRDLFINALHSIVRSGTLCRYMPWEFLSWSAVYQQMPRWIAASVFKRMVHDLRVLLRACTDRVTASVSIDQDRISCGEYSRRVCLTPRSSWRNTVPITHHRESVRSRSSRNPPAPAPLSSRVLYNTIFPMETCLRKDSVDRCGVSAKQAEFKGTASWSDRNFGDH